MRNHNEKSIAARTAGFHFFALTFILNRSMNLRGGYWLWSASLRYLFMLPIRWAIVKWQKGDKAVFRESRTHPGSWLLWSTVGFGLFYAPICLASCYGESWFVAAAWQITIVAGVLLTPLFGGRIPVKNLLFSFVILLGIFLLQISHLDGMQMGDSLIALLLILLAGICYPLGKVRERFPVSSGKCPSLLIRFQSPSDSQISNIFTESS